jgi:hypothetical protein
MGNSDSIGMQDEAFFCPVCELRQRRRRYAKRAGKTRIPSWMNSAPIAAITANTPFHSWACAPSLRAKAGAKPVYASTALLMPLKRIWFATDQLCSKKLKAVIQ